MRISNLLPVLLLGCATGHQSVTRAPAAQQLAAYKAVTVSKVDTLAWLQKNPRIRENPAYATWRSELEVAADQIPASAKKGLSDFYEVRNEGGEGAFLVRSELTDYNPGQSDPLGEGSGRVTVHVRLVDAKSGDLFGEADVTGTATGTSVRSAYDQCGQGIARFIVDHRPKKQ